MKNISRVLFVLICLTTLFTGCAPQNKEFVPQWAKTVIWYQIFPERFRNGDPGNDPTVKDIQGADPQEAPTGTSCRTTKKPTGNRSCGSTCCAGATAGTCRASSISWIICRTWALRPFT